MKIAVMASLFAKRDMKVDAGHWAKIAVNLQTEEMRFTGKTQYFASHFPRTLIPFLNILLVFLKVDFNFKRINIIHEKIYPVHIIDFRKLWP